ncbi:RHS repeat-associated core domain-containing protein [Persicobacter psychrovividus]
MAIDKNSKIDTIIYNFLNLPLEIVFEKETGQQESKSIKYMYDAFGNKLNMENSAGEMSDYIAGIHYNKGDLSFVQTREGKVEREQNGSNFEYSYNLTDHLGNVRQVLNKDGAVQQSTDYYPFGLVAHGGSTAKNRYLYNNKELQEETEWHDYGARMYDAQIGRFFTQDRFAEKYLDLTPYQYGANNPIKFIDVNGDSTVVTISGTDTQFMKTTNNQETYQGYKLSVYENLSLEQYNQLKENGELPDPSFSTYVGRDAHYVKRKGKAIKHSEKRYGSNNEAPPGEYYIFQKGTNGDATSGKYNLYIGDENGSRIINGKDGVRKGIALHGWDPRFSQGCLTTFKSGSNGGVSNIINAIPDLTDDSQPVRLIIEKRPVVPFEKGGQSLRIGIKYGVPYSREFLNQ